MRDSECYEVTSHLLYNSVDVCARFESARLTKQWLISNRLKRWTELSRNSNPGGIRAKEAGSRVAGTSAEFQDTNSMTQGGKWAERMPGVGNPASQTWDRQNFPSCLKGTWSITPLRCPVYIWNINLSLVSLTTHTPPPLHVGRSRRIPVPE